MPASPLPRAMVSVIRQVRNPLLPAQPVTLTPAHWKPLTSHFSTVTNSNLELSDRVLANSMPTPEFAPVPVTEFHVPTKLRFCTWKPETFPPHNPMPSPALMVALPVP